MTDHIGQAKAPVEGHGLIARQRSLIEDSKKGTRSVFPKLFIYRQLFSSGLELVVHLLHSYT